MYEEYYEGERNEEGLEHGFGKKQFKHGDINEGNFNVILLSINKLFKLIICENFTL